MSHQSWSQPFRASSNAFENNPFAQASPPSRTARGPSPLNQHRQLFDLIHTIHATYKGQYSSQIRASVIRQLFATIWYHPAWEDLFLMPRDPPEEDLFDGLGESSTWQIKKKPRFEALEDWRVKDTYGIESSWSLKTWQDRVEAGRKRAGKAPARKVRPGTSCGKIMQRYDRSYTCKTCALDPSCVLCVDCFKASDHEGHEVLFGQSFSFAAACDCGDTSAWKQNSSLGCTHHPPGPRQFHHPDLATDSPEIPTDLQKALYDTIVICLEFIIEVFQYSPLPSEYGKLPKDEAEMRSDKTRNTGEPKTHRGDGPWSVVLWADDKHVWKEITRQIRDATGANWESSETWAKVVEVIGRKIIVTSADPIIAFHTASMFQQIDLGVSLRLANDTCKEEVAGILIGWLADMCRSFIAGDDLVFRRLLSRALTEPRTQRPGWVGSSLAPDLKDLKDNVMPDHSFPNRYDWLMQLDSRMWRRAKWDLRQIYSSLHRVDESMTMQFARHFANNYIRVFEQYFFHDREGDTNLVYSMAYLVLSNGQACAYATEKSNLFISVLDVIHSYYTDQFSEHRFASPPKNIDYADGREKPMVDTSSSVFRGKKGIALFSHLRALLRHKEIRTVLVSSHLLLSRTLAFLNMFVGIQSQKRQSGEHIDFEVDWTRSFSVLGELAKSCRELGEAFLQATPDQLLAGLTMVSNRILCDMMLVSGTLDPEKYTKPIEHDVEHVLFYGTKFPLMKVSVSRIEAFSFHHYMNLVFAEMIKACRVVMYPRDDGMTLRQFVDAQLFRSPNPADTERMKLMILEWPMQKHVVLSQIRNNMWAKNGVAMRGQYHHYREISIREATLDQEFFLLQLGLCIMDPLGFMIALIDRFGLANFFRGDVNSPELWSTSSSEPVQRIAMFEDFILLVINLVTDTVAINGWDQAQISRRHIIHQLALHPLTYSEILKKLPERSLDRGSLIPILDEVADFKDPTDSTPGKYALKSDFFAEVDPYWHHYSRNDLRTAMEILTSRAKKLDPDGPEPLILPPPLELPPAGMPFSNLSLFLSTPVAFHVVHWTIAHCMILSDPNQWSGYKVPDVTSTWAMPQLEVLLDLGLQLALLSIQAEPRDFSIASIELMEQSGAMSIFQNLWYMQKNDAFKSFRPKVDYILDIIVSHLPLAYTADYRNQREADSMLNIESPVAGKAKAAAAARQKMIMANFAKRQADFAAMMPDDDDDEEEIEELPESYGSCIVCQDDVSAKKPGGMLAFVQPSRILRDAVHDRDWFEESLHVPTSLDKATRYLRFGDVETSEPAATNGYPGNALKFGVHITACSHLMHEDCMAKYFEATKTRHSLQLQRQQPENAVRQEFLCPLCKSLSNVVLPVERTNAPLKSPLSTKTPGRPATLSEKIRDVCQEGLLQISDSAKIWDHHVDTGELVPWFSDCTFNRQSLDPTHRRLNMRQTARMIERGRVLLRALSQQSQRIRQKQSHLYIPDDVVGYTISVCEVAQRGLRGSGRTVAEQIPETSLKLIQKLIGVLQLELDLFFGPKYDRTVLRVALFARFLPEYFRASVLPIPVLLRSPLGIVIESAALAPDLLHSVMVMGYYAELTRVILGVAVFIKRSLVNKSGPAPRSSPPQDDDLQDALSVFGKFRPLVLAVVRNAGPSYSDSDGVLGLISEEMLAKLLYSHTLPFLRRCAIIYYAVNSSYPVTDPDLIVYEGCEYSRLLSLLGIPRPRETLMNPAATETSIVNRWLTHWQSQGRIVPHLEFPGTYELIRLPHSLENLVLRFANQRCGVCGTKPTYPALCLNCGTFVCMGGDCCMQGEQGECNLHMRECGAVVGIFIDIKRWMLLYLFAGSGSFGPMPYLDSHGELDPSMRRGNRQYLNPHRMEEVRRSVWLNHMIPTLAARRLELSTDGGGWGCL